MAEFTNVCETWLVLAQGNNNNANSPNITWFAIPIIIMLFYLMMMKPERRKRQEHEQQVKNLKQNDRVVTYSGIYGTVVNVSNPESIQIRVDENTNTRLRILRSAVMTIEREDEGKDIAKEKK